MTMRQTPNLLTTELTPRSPQGCPSPIWLQKTMVGVYLLLICLEFACVTPLLAEPPPTFTITKHKNLFSAHIIDAPLKEVLASLIPYVPIKFFINGNATHDLISASFSNEPLEKTLETLLNGYDYAIRSRRLEAPSQTSEIRYLTEVDMISRNSAENFSPSHEIDSISSAPNSAQSTLGQPTRVPEVPDQEAPLNLETAFDADDFQAAIEEAFQGDDSEARTLAKELMQEFPTANK
jgi:hypothetical protein